MVAELMRKLRGVVKIEKNGTKDRSLWDTTSDRDEEER